MNYFVTRNYFRLFHSSLRSCLRMNFFSTKMAACSTTNGNCLDVLIQAGAYFVRQDTLIMCMSCLFIVFNFCVLFQ